MPKTPTEDERAAAELLGESPTLSDALAAQDGEERLHDILTNEEVEAARAKARTLVENQRKKKATEALIAQETLRLEQEEGLTTGNGAKDEMVDLYIDLAEHTTYLSASGRPYHHGHTYTIPRHVADSLRETMSRGWKHQDEIDGKSMTQSFQAKRQFEALGKSKAGKVVLNATTGAVQNRPAYQAVG